MLGNLITFALAVAVIWLLVDSAIEFISEE